MLLELAVGDAYGVNFEYAPETARYNDLSGYVRHPRHRIIPGTYTDDTQMSLAIAEVIVSGADWTPPNLANAFVAAFRRDPREGYASGLYDFLRHVRDGAQFLAEIQAESDKSRPRCAPRPSASTLPSPRSSSGPVSRPRSLLWPRASA
jgi:ADP-ribosyl-[dinitrogen reductase] hydrolase